MDRLLKIGDRVELVTVDESLELVKEYYNVGDTGTVIGYDDLEDGLGVLVLFDRDNTKLGEAMSLYEYEVKKL